MFSMHNKKSKQTISAIIVIVLILAMVAPLLAYVIM